MGNSLLYIILSLPLVANPGDLAKGKNEEMNSCLLCHSSRIIHSQRLTRQAWIRELEKMERWGATIQEREALLDYLSESYGNDKAPTVPPLSENGTGEKK